MLAIWGCSEIESFPEGGLPSKVEQLEIGECKLVARWREWGIQALSCLGQFYYFTDDASELESFADDRLLPSILNFFKSIGYNI